MKPWVSELFPSEADFGLAGTFVSRLVRSIFFVGKYRGGGVLRANPASDSFVEELSINVDKKTVGKSESSATALQSGLFRISDWWRFTGRGRIADVNHLHDWRCSENIDH